ncbi:MAG: bacillithiol biosynthesis BshC, partial [Zetaproteobacteria bacterium]|nr:bacillithiol biosynthesis BshC [Flavobacteriales bacterium]
MTPKNSCDSKTKDADCCENLSIKQSQNASLSYKNTGYFSSLICDYLDKKDSLKPFYQNFSNLNGYKQQIALKQNCISASSQTRQVLVSALKLQYKK